MPATKSTVGLIVASALLSSSAFAQEPSLLEVIRDLTETERNENFKQIIDSSGDHSCSEVTHSVIRGVDQFGDVYVTVRCSDGMDYALALSSDRSGVVACELLEAMTQLDCWHPFD